MAGGTDGREEAEIQSDAGRQGGVAQRSIRCAGDVWHSGAYRGPRDDQWISLSVVADADGRLSRHGGEQDDAPGGAGEGGGGRERGDGGGQGRAHRGSRRRSSKRNWRKARKRSSAGMIWRSPPKKELAISIRDAKPEETR